MELKTYFRPVLKWWWLLAAAAVVAAVSSFVVLRRQPLLFQSRATLVVGKTVYEANPSGGDFYLNQQLAGFYADLAMRDPVRDATLQALGLEWLPEYTARALPNSLLIEILVADTDPTRAQLVSNELAKQLINQTPTNDSNNGERQRFIENQLNMFETDITTTQDEIETMQLALGSMSSARLIAQTQKELSSLEQKLSTLRSDYAALLASSDRGAGNTITLIEPASLPSRPTGPNTATMVLLSALVAVAIAAAAAYLIEYLDDTLKSPEEINHLLDLPVIGFITEVEKGKTLESYLTKEPRSGVAEAFRSLRTDLEFSGVDKPLKTIYITSSEMESGKTSIAVNLAIVIAQSGKRVILVDADLRRPSVHRYLGLTNQRGLSDVFRGNLDIYNATTPYKEGNIFVITSGTPPPNPSELLGSKKMDQILESLKKVADIIIVDGPPFLVTDATILATKVDGVLLIVRYGYTRKNGALNAAKQLKRAGARSIGVVLNRIPRTSGAGYGYGSYHYYPGYYLYEVEANAGQDEATDKPKRAGKSSPKPKTPPDQLVTEKTEG
jgi:capsular exopolysaccharide synthesis family protein